MTYIIDGARTPFLKAKGIPGPFTAADLAVFAGREVLARQPINPMDIDETVVGCVMPSEHEVNIARIIGLRLGCGDKTPGFTVQRNCASGLQAIDSAALDIASGRCNLVLAGGSEAMSRAPLLLRPDMVRWLAKFYKAKSVTEKIKLVSQLKPNYFKPIIALLCGLSDPLYNINMGQTAENLVAQYHIGRKAMDKFALNSHRRLIDAQDGGWLSEVCTLYDTEGRYYDHDDGVRRDTTLEKLAELKPFFDQYGLVTAGNSSQVTDGATMLLLASDKAVEQFKLEPLAKIVDIKWAALDPRVMGLGPVMAASPLMQQHQLKFSDVDYWEINEAFAAQVLACIAAWNLKTFGDFGQFDEQRLNVDGGAIAIGHPIGASGARITYHLATLLKRKNAKRGIATLCVGGGQGGAILLER